jgi:hypothetical protein
MPGIDTTATLMRLRRSRLTRGQPGYMSGRGFMGLFHLAFKNFRSQLASTPAGQRHIYSFAIAAEEGDEHGVFDMLAIEVRGVEQFPIIAEALRPYIEFGANTFLAVVAFRYVMRNGIIGSESNRRVAAWLFDGVDVLAEKFGLMKAFRLQA